MMYNVLRHYIYEMVQNSKKLHNIRYSLTFLKPDCLRAQTWCKMLAEV